MLHVMPLPLTDSKSIAHQQPPGGCGDISTTAVFKVGCVLHLCAVLCSSSVVYTHEQRHTAEGRTRCLSLLRWSCSTCTTTAVRAFSRVQVKTDTLHLPPLITVQWSGLYLQRRVPRCCACAVAAQGTAVFAVADNPAHRSTHSLLPRPHMKS